MVEGRCDTGVSDADWTWFHWTLVDNSATIERSYGMTAVWTHVGENYTRPCGA
jgi:hypothetical protein